jgi:hypothetical protein
MTTRQLAEEALPQKFKRRIKRVLGPWGVFFEGFLRNPVMVGSIIPSSDRTVAKMLAPVDWDNTKLFVEYGPGIGTFCQPVLNRLRPDATLLVIDLNEDFIVYLRKTIRDSRFIAVHGSAAETFGIDSCTIHTAGGSGIEIQDAQAGEIRNCAIQSPGQCGIDLHRARIVTVADNRIKQCGADGIRVGKL